MKTIIRQITCCTALLLALAFCLAITSAEEAASEQTLTIYGTPSYSLMEAYQQACPNVAVSYMPAQDAQQVISGAIAHETQPDIYCFFSLETPYYHSLRDRGYLAEISDEDVRSFVSSTYSGIRDECYDHSGTLRAMPIAVILSNRLAVNSSLWETLELGNVPGTWDELFDFLEKWCASPELYGRYALLGYASAEETRNMIGYVLRADYDCYRQAADPSLPYSTEVYQHLLHRLQDVPLENLDYAIEPEDTLFTDTYLPSPCGGLFSSNSMKCLQLSIDGAEPTRTQANVHFVCINASSPNQELAMRFVQFLSQNLRPEVQAMLCTEYDAQVAGEEFAQKEAEYTEQLNLLEAQLEGSEDAAQQQAIQAEINRVIQDYNYYLQNEAYLISESSLQNYQKAIQGGITVNYGEGILDQDVLANLSEKHRMFIAGQMTVEQYTDILDNIVYMQEQEWQ